MPASSSPMAAFPMTVLSFSWPPEDKYGGDAQHRIGRDTPAQRESPEMPEPKAKATTAGRGIPAATTTLSTRYACGCEDQRSHPHAPGELTDLACPQA
jgi:hypothetical protein